MLRKPGDLEHLLSQLREAGEGPRASLSDILDTVGTRSFGPVLLLAGLVVLAPIIGDIPGVPTTIGLFVLLTAGQLLAGRDHVWLPKWMLGRSVSRAKLARALDRARRPVQFLDRLTRARLQLLLHPPLGAAVPAAALLVALALPIMEFVPFSANAAGIILTLLGLSLIGEDGLFAFLALTLTAAAVGVVLVVLV